ncbi:MAG: glycosyltransferase family 2 protein [Phormidium sp.]
MNSEKFPKISIVTPSFNQADFLEATIKSVLYQEYPNLEYIIIDGGSTDGSLEIIKKYEAHLHFWCSEPDRGQYDGINKGFTHATGEIFSWINSDDMYYPWAFKTVSSIMSSLPEIEWLTTLYPGGWDYQGFCRGFGSIPGYSKEAFLDGGYLPWGRKAFGWIQQESTFWKRELWEKVDSHIRTEFSLAGDFDLWSRFFLYADLYGINSPISGFRRQGNSRSSTNYRQYISEAEKSLAAMRDKLNWSPNTFRNMALKFPIKKIPKIRKWSESMYMYSAKRVVRKNLSSSEGYWQVEEYNFFY